MEQDKNSDYVLKAACRMHAGANGGATIYLKSEIAEPILKVFPIKKDLLVEFDGEKITISKL
ncbi:MAG: hypothetical protein JXA38_06710 [Methanosarcinaceae archaeon]|nr:hypothetical protein [Methanosarcinaceae archaeon]